MLRQQCPAVERVDEQPTRGALADVRAAHEEVAGKVDAVDMQPSTPRNLHVDERQRDGNAGAMVEHLVETAVARILVALAAGESLLLKKVGVEGADAGER